MTKMRSLYSTDGKCHNANGGKGSLHECGKPATWLGTKRTGWQSGFCDRCKEKGDEAKHFASWERLAPKEALPNRWACSCGKVFEVEGASVKHLSRFSGHSIRPYVSVVTHRAPRAEPLTPGLELDVRPRTLKTAFPVPDAVMRSVKRMVAETLSKPGLVMAQRLMPHPFRIEAVDRRGSTFMFDELDFMNASKTYAEAQRKLNAHEYTYISLTSRKQGLLKKQGQR